MSKGASLEKNEPIEVLALDALGRTTKSVVSPFISAREEPAFVLTTWPWRETSLIVSLFTKHHGRVTVVARGAKRPAGRFRGLLDAFSPLLVNFSGKAEVKTLSSARWIGGLAPLTGEGLLTGFYLNELIFRLLPAESAAPELFDAYTRTLSTIARGVYEETERAMREFEVDLLRLCGWGQQLEDFEEAFPGCVREGEILDARFTQLHPEEAIFDASCVRAVMCRDFTDANVLKGAREILRSILEFYARSGKTLASRETLAKWRQFRIEKENEGSDC